MLFTIIELSTLLPSLLLSLLTLERSNSQLSEVIDLKKTIVMLLVTVTLIT